MKQTNVDLRAANNAVMEVVGVVNAAINALALSGERFCCTSKLYVVENIDEVYLSLDVLRGLRIVGKNFLEAGTSPNQHGNHPLIWDKTGTVVELLPNSRTSLEEDTATPVKVPILGRPARPPDDDDDDDAVWARRAARASRRPYAQATLAPAESRQSLQDRVTSKL